MKKNNFIVRFAFSLVVCIWGLMSCSIPTNQIHYTTKDNSILELNPEKFGYGQIIISHYFSKEDSVCIIEFSEDVKCIGDWAFAGCESLKNITIPKSVTEIGGYAFYGCKSLTSITMPESVTEIGESAFDGCKSLENIKVDFNNPIYDSRGDCNALIHTKSNTLIRGCQNTIIPESVTEIGESAFDGCESLKNITIPKSVRKIGEFAFSYCESLTSITIPESVREIGGYAFARCSSLTSITIHEWVRKIGECAFYGCESLTTVYVYNFASITDNTFEDCPNVIIEHKRYDII